MTFDPTIDYGVKDLSSEENLVSWKFCELLKVLITLSSDAARQMEIVGAGVVTDEMAEDFHSYFTESFNSYLERGLLTSEQKDMLLSLDRFFDERSGQVAPDFWNDDNLATHPDWVHVRQKAKTILEAMEMDQLMLEFERKEEYTQTLTGKKLLMQSTKTRLVKKIATILDSTPVSGTHPEYSFGERFLFPLWVKFRDEQGVWYGCFSKLWHKGFNAALVDNARKTAFIAASGKGYLVNLADKQLIYQTEENLPVTSVIKTDNPQYFIASSYNQILIFDTRGLIKLSEPDLMIEELHFTGQKGNKAIGSFVTRTDQFASDHDFELDLNTFGFSFVRSSKPGFWARLLGE